MKAVRIILKQSSANYRKEEALDNKMTYPLPPITTVVGALHTACGYNQYNEMAVSIQGQFESMTLEPYTDYCFLNSIMDDRGILVKMRNSDLLGSAFEKVAAAKKSQGNSFRKKVTIQVFDEELLDEYICLKDLADKIKDYKSNILNPKLDEIKLKKKELATLKKTLDKKSDEYKKIVIEEKELKSIEKELKDNQLNYEQEYYNKPIAKYKSLTTSLKYYEILHNIELVIHVKATDKVLDDILDNIYNLKSIGRSEDFVEVVDAKLVDLTESNTEVKSKYSAYLNYDDIEEENIFTEKEKQGRDIAGTKYYINKKYDIVDGKRIFEKKKVLYASEFSIDETSDNVLVDNFDVDSNKKYIVNFL